MLMQNGGRIGPANVPSRASASGIWSPDEATQAMGLSIWPLPNSGLAAWDPVLSGAGCAFSNGNRTYTSGGGTHDNAVGALYRSSGKYYWEMLIDTYVGSQTTVGMYASTPGASTWPGLNGFGIILNSTELFWSAVDQGAAGGAAVLTGDVMAFAIDFGAGKMWYALNNTYVGGGNPAAGSSPLITGLSGPLTQGILGVTGTVATIHGVASDLTYSPPSGFSAWG